MADDTGNGNNNNSNNNQNILDQLAKSQSSYQRVLNLLKQIETQKKIHLDLEVKEYELGERRLEQDKEEFQRQQEKVALQAEDNKALETYLKTLDLYNRRRKAGLPIEEDFLKTLREQHQALTDLERADLRALETQQKKVVSSQRVKTAYAAVTKSYKKNIDTLSELTGVNMSHLKSMKGIGKQSFATARGLDDINKTMALQTGYTQSLQKQMGLLYRDSSRTGLLYKEQAAILAGLSNEYKDFNALTTDAQKATFNLARRFKVQGVEGAEFGKVLNLLNRGLGITGTQGLKAAASFEKIAMKTGRPLTAILKDFQALGPQIARFGNQATDVFERLQVQARQLGMESKKIFEIGELFDTFESSADAAGRLNAQFGTQLESVNLMAMDHADRFKTLRGEFDRMGLVVGDFNHRQVQMLASIMKVDEATARQMFGDPMQMRRIQKEMATNEARQKGFLTAQKRIQVAYEKFYMTVEPLLVKLMDFFGDAAEFMDNVLSSSIGRAISSVVLMAGKFWLLLTPIRLIWKAMKFIGTALADASAAVANFGSKAMSFLAPVGKFFGFLGRIVTKFLGPFLLIKDVLQSMGVGNKGVLGFGAATQETAQSRLAAGTAGAAVAGTAGASAFGVGAIPAAMFGYSIGREMPEMTGTVNDYKGGDFVHAAGVKGRADDLRITDAEGRLLQLGTFGENRSGRGRENGGKANQMGPIHVKELTLPITLQLEGTQLDFIEKAVDIVLDPMVIRG